MEINETSEVCLSRLVVQERLLRHQIDALTSFPLYDQLAVQRLKRFKLDVVNQIEKIKSTTLPDIIA
ncbi:MAG: YdcH family protein [Alphaproteobacteria bacterium]